MHEDQIRAAQRLKEIYIAYREGRLIDEDIPLAFDEVMECIDLFVVRDE